MLFDLAYSTVLETQVRDRMGQQCSTENWAAQAKPQRVELGKVHWLKAKDMATAKSAAQEQGKLIALLFQEVPG